MQRVATNLILLVFFPFLTTLAYAQPADNSAPPARPDDQSAHPLLQLFDTDSDGDVSTDEIAAAAAKLKQLAASNDGRLDRRELRRLVPWGSDAGRRRGERRVLGARRRNGGVSESDLTTRSLAQDDTEQRILDALEAMREGPRFRNVSHEDGRLLRLLAESMHAKRVVEIGTSTGESATWFALAMEATGGHVYTHEIDEGRADIAAGNFEKAGVDDLITIIIGDAHETVQRYKDPNDELFVDASKQESIDILFLDADKDGYIDYMDKLMPLIRPGGLVIAHNMNTRQADLRFVKAITENPQLETMILLRDGTGVGVTLKKR